MVEEKPLTIQIHIQPNSSRNEITGMHDGRLKIKIAAPPVDGKANMRLIAFLAKMLSVPKSSIEIVKGQNSKLKTLRIKAINKAALDTFLSQYSLS